MMKKKTFTLVEILVVIAIIAILAGLTYPALMAVQNSSRRTKTETILTGVNTAIKVYKGDYYGLPEVGGKVQPRIGSWSGDNNDAIEPDSDYITFFDILTYKNIEKPTGVPSDAVKKANPKAKQYLDPPKDYFNDDDNLHSIRDAWNHPIVIFLDDDGDQIVNLGGYNNGDKELGGDSVAVSMGNQPDPQKRLNEHFIVVK